MVRRFSAKELYGSSILPQALKNLIRASGGMADAKDLKSFGGNSPCGFDSLLAHYLEGLPIDKKVGGAVFVAGWLTSPNLETEEEKEIAKPWIETPIDFEKVKQHTKKFFAIFSGDDEVIPPSHQKIPPRRGGIF